MQKKYQVFVSSTFRDLMDERQDAIRTILDLGHIPAGMELFPATDMEQLEYIKRIIDECDYYLLIIGARYGSLDPDGVSYTEREYDYAVETGKTVIGMIHDKPENIVVGKSDTAPRLVENLALFRDKVASGRLVKYWSDRSSLESTVTKSLAKAFNDFPAVGWVRGNAAASFEMLQESNDLLKENADLKSQIDNLRSQITPQFDDIASLDEVIEIRYRTKYNGSRNAPSYTDRTYSISWRKLFLGLAGRLDTGRTAAAIFSGFKVAAEEDGLGYVPYDMNDTDKLRIKVQFVALGLIKTKVSSTTQGVFEFLYLTDKGKRLFLEGLVTRKIS